MRNVGRWSLAVAVLVISSWAWLHVLPDRAPAAMSQPSARTDPQPVGSADDRITPVNQTNTLRAPVNGQIVQQGWAERYRIGGSNYFEFVRLAARAAYEGDGAAQYYISRALTRCEETNALYRDADSADQAVSHVSYFPAFLELERQEYLDCQKFRTGNPFKDLPQLRGGYSADYWRERAVQSRYPVAMVAVALDSPGQHAQMLASALATGNTEAMLLFGWSQATANETTESAPIMGAAWVLAACRNGANCGPMNDVLPLTPCRAGLELGCTVRYTAVDELTATLGTEALAEADLLALDIQRSLKYRDPGRLMKYLSF
jgi:hypothetical protein